MPANRAIIAADGAQVTAAAAAADGAREATSDAMDLPCDQLNKICKNLWHTSQPCRRIEIEKSL